MRQPHTVSKIAIAATSMENEEHPEVHNIMVNFPIIPITRNEQSKKKKKKTRLTSHIFVWLAAAPHVSCLAYHVEV